VRDGRKTAASFLLGRGIINRKEGFENMLSDASYTRGELLFKGGSFLCVGGGWNTRTRFVEGL
jgi:hypothetical protein